MHNSQNIIWKYNKTCDDHITKHNVWHNPLLLLCIRYEPPSDALHVPRKIFLWSAYQFLLEERLTVIAETYMMTPTIEIRESFKYDVNPWNVTRKKVFFRSNEFKCRQNGIRKERSIELAGQKHVNQKWGKISGAMSSHKREADRTSSAPTISIKYALISYLHESINPIFAWIRHMNPLCPLRSIYVHSIRYQRIHHS